MVMHLDHEYITHGMAMDVSRHGHKCSSWIDNNMHPSWKDRNTLLKLADMD